jgi:hypothetical protein
LYFYGARWYDSALGRFGSPDTLIPEASQGVQAWDRYAGMNNNPVRYNDPSGHDVGCVELGRFNCGLMEHGALKVDPLAFAQLPMGIGVPYKNPLSPYVPNPKQASTPYGPPAPAAQTSISASPTFVRPQSDNGDYETVTANYSPPGSLVGVTGTVTKDKFSNWYVGLGLNVGKSYPAFGSLSKTTGYIGRTPGNGTPTNEEQTEDFLSGFSVNASLGAGGGGGVTWNPSAGTVATEIGYYTPQLGVGATYNWEFINY